MSNSNRQQFWYVVKQENNTCKAIAFDSDRETPKRSPEKTQWGPFASEQEAIARKIGLIRAGKCQPE